MGMSSMILVSILEGKNFPIRNDKLLSIEARFDGEVMATEIVPHTMFPNFNTELGWEVDKKGLQMHRLQRTPIKLQCYALDKDLSRKECIGYIVLDTRLAQENSHLNAKWHPLLNCKYSKDKPEILLTMFLEKESASTQPSVAAPKQKPFNGTSTYTIAEMNSLRKNPPTAKPNETPKSVDHSPSNTLDATFIPELAGYRIGPPSLCNEKFQFSVMVAFAANLNKLAPPVALRTSKEFCFCYSIFENTVKTGRFASLANPDFLAERASVFISSSADILSSYFKQHPHLEVTLYCGDTPLAVGKIPLGLLATVNEHEMDKKPLLIEGSVQVYPIEKPRVKTEDLSPFVGVTVVLQKVQNTNSPVEQVNAVQKFPKSSPDVLPPSSSHSSNHVIPQRPSSIVQNYEEINGNNTLYNDRSQNQLERHNRTSSSSTSRSDTPHAAFGYLSQNSSHNATPKSPPKSSIAGDRMPSSKNMNGHVDPVPNDNVPHYFCFSLDLCNFRATHLELPVSLFIRYTYPFFGASTAICTQTMDVTPGLDVTIPQGFCQFKFATTASLLKSTFHESPLMLEIIQRRKQGSNRQERLIGTAKLNFFQVLDAVIFPQVIDKKHTTQRMCTCKILVFSPEGREISEIQAVVKLDDFGPTLNLSDKLPNKSKAPYQLRSSVSSFDVTSMRQNGYNHDELLQAALEVEVWKERQKEIFRSELKDKEMQHLKVLVTEWKQRDTEREILLQRRLHECQKLEDKLKQMLQDAEIKEKHVAAQEAELSLRSQSFDRQQEQLEREQNLQIQKMKADYNELVRLERLNLLEAEEKLNALQRKIKDQEEEIIEQKNLMHSLKLQLHKQPDVELKTEVNILKMEKTELQQRLETLASSKQRYKVQWTNAIRQISLLQQDGYRNGTILLKKNEEISKKNEEIAVLRQLSLTDQPKKIVLDNLPAVTANTNEQSDAQSAHSDDKDDSASSHSTAETLSNPNQLTADKDTDSPLSTRALDLISQRDKLLESRIYSEGDDIIKKLTAHIEQAKSSST